MTDEKAPRIWVTQMPFRKDGSPVVSGFGATTRGVVIVPIDTWTKLSSEIPELGAKQFNVGTFD